MCNSNKKWFQRVGTPAPTVCRHILPPNTTMQKVSILQTPVKNLFSLFGWCGGGGSHNIHLNQNCRKFPEMDKSTKNIFSLFGEWGGGRIKSPAWQETRTFPKSQKVKKLSKTKRSSCVLGWWGVWTPLEPILGQYTFERMSNVCLHISCDDINSNINHTCHLLATVKIWQPGEWN